MTKLDDEDFELLRGFRRLLTLGAEAELLGQVRDERDDLAHEIEKLRREHDEARKALDMLNGELAGTAATVKAARDVVKQRDVAERELKDLRGELAKLKAAVKESIE